MPITAINFITSQEKGGPFGVKLRINESQFRAAYQRSIFPSCLAFPAPSPSRSEQSINQNLFAAITMTLIYTWQ